MIHLTLSGSPYEIGFQHGQALRALVDGLVKYEARRHAYLEPKSPDVEGVLGRVHRTFPELVEELRGIADGSGVPWDLLLEVNLRVLHYCTVIAFTDSEVRPTAGQEPGFPGLRLPGAFHRPAQ